MSTTLAGKDADVKLGTYVVAECATWEIGPMTNEMVEHWAFGQGHKYVEFGVGDSGTLTVTGYYDKTDTTGQTLIESAFQNKSKLSALRLYVDNSSYWCPDITNDSTACGLPETWGPIRADRSGMVELSFSVRCSGRWTLA